MTHGQRSAAVGIVLMFWCGIAGSPATGAAVIGALAALFWFGVMGGDQ